MDTGTMFSLLMIFFSVILIVVVVSLVIFLYNKVIERPQGGSEVEVHSDDALLVRVKRRGNGKVVLIDMDPNDVEDNEPDYSQDLMPGEIPFDLLAKFFSGQLPKEQMQFIERKLQSQGVSVCVNYPQGWTGPDSILGDEKEMAFLKNAGFTVVSPESVGNEALFENNSQEVRPAAPAPSVEAPVQEEKLSEPVPEKEEDITPEVPVETPVQETVSSEVKEEAPVDTPSEPLMAEETSEEDDSASVKEEPVKEEEPSSGEELPAVSSQESVPQVFREEELDEEGESPVCPNEIPTELLDVLSSNMTDPVLGYYCACRAGLDIKFSFRKEDRDRNTSRLRMYREQFDGKTLDELISYTILFGQLSMKGSGYEEYSPA